MTETRIKEIKDFFKVIYFNLEFLKDKNDWEYDFVFHAASTYGFSKEEMEEFIKLYLAGKLDKPIKSKYKVTDLATGIIYPSIQALNRALNLKRNNVYTLLKNNKERFMVEMINNEI